MAADVGEEEKQRASRSQTLVRGLEILDAVSDRPRNIAEIASVTGLTYSTVHRIVSVLLERRYLKAENPREFALDPRLIELGFAAYLDKLRGPARLRSVRGSADESLSSPPASARR